VEQVEVGNQMSEDPVSKVSWRVWGGVPTLTAP
jgi:hypothetical protein